METTTNYEKFKLLKENRIVRSKHVNDIKSSIEKYGYLTSKPIIVNKDFEIIDGQHRFRALKELNLPVTYEIEDDKENLLVDLNKVQKRWVLEDYVKYYALKKQNPNYIRVLRIKDSTKLPTTAILIAGFRRGTNGEDTHRIQNGELEFSETDELAARLFYEKYVDFINKTRLLNRTKLCIALTTVSGLDNFKWETLYDRANKYPTLAYNCRTKEEYVNMLIRLYNFNLKKDKI